MEKLQLLATQCLLITLLEFGGFYLLILIVGVKVVFLVCLAFLDFKKKKKICPKKPKTNHQKSKQIPQPPHNPKPNMGL